MTDTTYEEQILADFAKIGTATISDALDKLGIHPGLDGIGGLVHGQRMVGRAYTVRYVPASTPAGTVGDYIDDVRPGNVIVLENQARTDCTVWGDILTATAHAKGIAGTVISGVCRDIHRALDLKYPIYSSGHFMRTGKDRVEVADVQVPVAVGNGRVAPGDILIGDDDGVVVVPREHEEAVLAAAREIDAKEEGILGAVLAGATIAEARAQFGYHLLQRSES